MGRRKRIKQSMQEIYRQQSKTHTHNKNLSYYIEGYICWTDTCRHITNISSSSITKKTKNKLPSHGQYNENGISPLKNIRGFSFIFLNFLQVTQIGITGGKADETNLCDNNNEHDDNRLTVNNVNF